MFGRFGANFVKTMLRLAGEGREIGVVEDQRGTPTGAADLAAALGRIAVSPGLADRSGIYHYANRGETTWFELACRIFSLSAAAGGPSAEVRPIASRDYPVAAARPANSRLATDKISRDFSIAARPWEEALGDVVSALVGPSPDPGL